MYGSVLQLRWSDARHFPHRDTMWRRRHSSPRLLSVTGVSRAYCRKGSNDGRVRPDACRSRAMEKRGLSAMTIKRVAFIGNSLPRRCGIATFTTDLHQAVSSSIPGLETALVAMNDAGCSYNYPSTVQFQIDDGRIEDYIDTADALNARRFDVVCLQHEYGIFGGEAGAHILALLSRL